MPRRNRNARVWRSPIGGSGITKRNARFWRYLEENPPPVGDGLAVIQNRKRQAAQATKARQAAADNTKTVA